MNVGLPGTGIGGLFYLLTALAMPAVELVRLGQGRSSPARRRLVARQTGLALCVVLAIAVTGWLLTSLGPMFDRSPPGLLAITGSSGESLSGRDRAADLLRVVPAVLTLVVLVGVILSVELLRLITGGSSRRARAGPLTFQAHRTKAPAKLAWLLALLALIIGLGLIIGA